MSKRMLMVMTSHEIMGDTGEKTGMWLEEFAAPYYAFKDEGYTITLASPMGGQVPIDPNSLADDAMTDDSIRYTKDELARSAIASTIPLEDVRADEFDAVFYPGGHGPLWDLSDNAHSIKLIEDTIAANKPAITKGDDQSTILRCSYIRAANSWLIPSTCANCSQLACSTPCKPPKWVNKA